LDKLVANLKFVSKVEPYKITPSEMALGIGRPLTDAEWDVYFENYPNKTKGKTGVEILKDYRTK